MKINETEINKFMPKGWVMVPVGNSMRATYICMDGTNPGHDREKHRATFTIRACYKRIEELEQKVQDLQEAYDDKVRITREISNLIDPVAQGGATTPALIDVQAQLQRDLPKMLDLLCRYGAGSHDLPEASSLIERYKHLLRG